MTLLDFLPGMGSLKYKWYTPTGKVTLRHSQVLDGVKELNKGFSSLQNVKVSTLDDILFRDRKKKTVLYIISSTNEFVLHQDADLNTQPFFKYALSVLKQVGMAGNRHED